MDAFVSRKKRKLYPTTAQFCREDDSTDLKLALLSSLFPYISQEILLDSLISTEGCVESTKKALVILTSPKKSLATGSTGHQSSLSLYRQAPGIASNLGSLSKKFTKKGQTLHLYSPEDISDHSPCSIIHNFLPTQDATDLLKELLEEVPTFKRHKFKLFENTVESPHTAAFYVDSREEQDRQRTEYSYNGSNLEDVRQSTHYMRAVASKVCTAVNKEVSRRIQTAYPNRKKLKYQSPNDWIPNAAFVNCYDGGSESVGFHSDQLTYLGPRAIIGSLSLGVAREFRVRRTVARDDVEAQSTNPEPQKSIRADEEGQISIHLPHNSLLVMHAEMQEEWKHSIHPANTIDPHPIAGNKRINITYRHYRENFHPRFTPRCKCNVPTVLKCVQKKRENRGRYMWTCDAGYTPGKTGCSFFQWAEFDDDGNPPWFTDSQPSNSLKDENMQAIRLTQ